MEEKNESKCGRTATVSVNHDYTVYCMIDLKPQQTW